MENTISMSSRNWCFEKTTFTEILPNSLKNIWIDQTGFNTNPKGGNRLWRTREACFREIDVLKIDFYRNPFRCALIFPVVKMGKINDFLDHPTGPPTRGTHASGVNIKDIGGVKIKTWFSAQGTHVEAPQCHEDQIVEKTRCPACWPHCATAMGSRDYFLIVASRSHI